MPMEHKTVPFEIKAVDSDGTITGIASVYGNVDQGGDSVQPGAFKSSLEAVAAGGRRIKMLWQHDPSKPIGGWDTFQDTGDGLMASGRVLAGVTHGKDAIELLRAKAIDGLSIGYRTLDEDWQRTERGSIRLIKAAELWEISVVTFPMNQDAVITDVKNLQTVRDVERILREAGVPNRFASLVATHGFDEAKQMLTKDHRDDDEAARAQALSGLLMKLQGLKETINA